MTPRILVGGIGNIFLGDDAFGVEVVYRLAGRPMSEDVRLIDFGIRGLDLAYALMDGYDHAILVDAVPGGQAPGTLYVIEPEIDEAASASAPPNMHQMDPVQVLRYVAMMGGKPPQLTVAGCEPESIVSEDMSSGMSPSVLAAVDPAVELVETLVGRLLHRDLPASSA
jgi:hydrogenase maturation protease